MKVQVGCDWYLIRVTVDIQVEVTAIKEKLVNFVNSVREEAESIHQDKFATDELPAAYKRKLGKVIRTIQDEFCPGSCVGPCQYHAHQTACCAPV